jgi:hypothetical protein
LCCSYIAEFVTALTEAPLKTQDIPGTVQVSRIRRSNRCCLCSPVYVQQVISALYQRYAEFANTIVPSFVRAFAKASELGDEKKGL